MAFNTNQGKQSFILTTGQTNIDFNFKVYQASNIDIYLTPVGQQPDDILDKLVLDTNYTITINGDDGGMVTLTVGGAIGDKIVLVRKLLPIRNISYPTTGELKAQTLNEDQDYQTYTIADEHLSLESAVIKLPDSATVVSSKLPNVIPEAYIRWNLAGDAIENDATVPQAQIESQLSEWLAEASALSAESEASAPYNTFVNDVTSNGDGTFTYTPTTRYSAYHWGLVYTQQDITFGANRKAIFEAGSELVIQAGGIVTGITKAMVGLSNADNTDDLSKPVSTLTEAFVNQQIAAIPPEKTYGPFNTLAHLIIAVPNPKANEHAIIGTVTPYKNYMYIDNDTETPGWYELGGSYTVALEDYFTKAQTNVLLADVTTEVDGNETNKLNFINGFDKTYDALTKKTELTLSKKIVQSPTDDLEIVNISLAAYINLPTPRPLKVFNILGGYTTNTNRNFSIGHFYPALQTTNFPSNVLFLLGGEFNRADFPLLWAWIQTQTGLLISETDWQTQNTAQGSCGFYSSGNGTTTFRVPNFTTVLKGGNGVTRLAGSYEADDIKSHAHTSAGLLLTNISGSPHPANVATPSYTGYTGGPQNLIRTTAVIYLVVAK